MKWLLIIAAAVFFLVLWRVMIASALRLPKVGDAAPGFSLPDQNGRTRTLEDFRDRYLALYFFPRADTPG